MSTYLRRRNPAAKLVVALVLSLLLVLVIDPVTPLLFLAATIAGGVAAGGIRVGTYARASMPLIAVAIGFVWSNAVFATPVPGDQILASWGPVRISETGLRFGTGLALRGFAIGVVSVTFIRSTDPADLVVSLIHDMRVPFRIGYALLAAYRFLPFVAQEYTQIRLAQRVRGVTRSPLAGVLSLFAMAIRRATRIAVAMDARGFAAAGPRTSFRVVPLTAADIAFALVSVATAVALLGTGALGGWLRLWDGRFSA